MLLDCARYQRYRRRMDDETRPEPDETGPEPFTVPLPPGFPPHGFPPPGAGDRVVFFRSEAPEGAPGKDYEDIMLRRVPRDIAMRYRAAAGGRGMTHAQYLSALVELHARIRALADAGDEAATSALAELGMQTVAV
jgi:hypothetical protein